MSDFSSRSLGAFLDAVASPDQPVPAGGSVAALTGAASANLVVLVCRVLRARGTLEKADLETRASRAADALTKLIDEDAASYTRLLAALGLPRSTPEQAEVRTAAVQAALVDATHSPLAVAGHCLEAVRLAHEVVAFATGSVRGDVRVAQRLAHAALLAAVETAEDNVSRLRDPAARQEMERQVLTLRAEGDAFQPPR